MHTPQRLLWIQEMVVGGFKRMFVKRSPHPDEETLRALDNLKASTRRREVIGVAVVAITHDGNYQLVIAGHAYDNPHSVIAGAHRLQRTAECLLPNLCADHETVD